MDRVFHQCELRAANPLEMYWTLFLLGAALALFLLTLLEQLGVCPVFSQFLEPGSVRHSAPFLRLEAQLAASKETGQ